VIEVQLEAGAALPGIEELVARAAEAALRRASQDVANSSLTVVLSDDEEMARLNEQYRGAQGPTDVLSFEFDDVDLTGEMGGYLGDIVISVERARAQAEDAGHSPERELAVLVAHGTLHLLGYDHAEEEEERVMFALQEAAAAEALDA